jgi:hypothetical protein
MSELRQIDRMAQGLMNSVNLVGVEGIDVIVEAPSELLKGRIEQPSIKSHVEPCISKIMGQQVRLRCVAKGDYVPRARPAPPAGPAETAVKSEAPPALESEQISGGGQPAPSPGGKASPIDPMVEEVLRLGGQVRAEE